MRDLDLHHICRNNSEDQDDRFFLGLPSAFKPASGRKVQASRPFPVRLTRTAYRERLKLQAVGASGAGEGAGADALGSVTISVLRTSTLRRG